MKKINCWSIDDVKVWLITNGYVDYVELFCDRHKIDGEILITLTKRDLISPPLNITVLGDVRRLCRSINTLRMKSNVDPSIKSSREEASLYDDDDDDTSDEELAKIVISGTDLHSSAYETKRCILSFLYLFVSCYTTSVVMAIVHNRVPDMKKYPPLPDIILDNLPLISWAFKASEAIIILYFFLWICILIFHRHRFILLKRYCNIFGSVFFMRSITLLFTSLSVPGTHHQCFAQMYIGWRATLKRSFEIMGYAGMSLNGVKSCGDYMFSGHTVVHTLMMLFITEYSPKKYILFHQTIKILTLFGIFFILAAHEHYTIDVILALYISHRTFTNYHVLITAQRLNRMLTKTWNPIFYYMEKPVELAHIPNEYENPKDAIKRWLNKIQPKINID